MSMKSKMTVVNGDGYGEILERLAAQEIALIRKHQLSQKMATQLHRDVWARVEKECPFRERPEAYIGARLEEAIARYISVGFHEAAGFTEEGFRKMLAPLIARAVKAFTPPAEFPIMNGEYSVLLVIPTAWVSLQRQVTSVAGTAWLFAESGETGGNPLATIAAGVSEVAEGGEAAPREPSVLVGIDARKMKHHRFEDARTIAKREHLHFFAAHELIQLFLVRPTFLSEVPASVALGETFGKESFGLSSAEPRPIPALHASGERHLGAGIGKPYYAARITMS